VAQPQKREQEARNRESEDLAAPGRRREKWLCFLGMAFFKALDGFVFGFVPAGTLESKGLDGFVFCLKLALFFGQVIDSKKLEGFV